MNALDSRIAKVEIENFTVFAKNSIDFSPGINAIIGANGSGKTHLMKVMFYLQRDNVHMQASNDERLYRLFQVEDLGDLIRTGKSADAKVECHTQKAYRLGFSIPYSDRSGSFEAWGATPIGKGIVRPVFIPAIDMFSHTKGYLAALREVRLDFDFTHDDIVGLLTLERPNPNGAPFPEVRQLLREKAMKVDVELDQDRFFFVRDGHKTSATIEAEGIRKIATLYRLIESGWIQPGTTLYWDEPEVNLNPSLMDELISAFLKLARGGVQIIFATHNYVILKELDLQRLHSDEVRFFNFVSSSSGVDVTTAEHPDELHHLIGAQYDRLLALQLGSNVGSKG